MPVSIPQVIILSAVAICMVVPVVGITARIALRPIVDAMTRLRESNTRTAEQELMERRVALLEQEIQMMEGMRAEVRRLSEEDDFRRQLTLPSKTPE